MMDRIFLTLGALLGAVGVGAGAFGAHGLKDRLTPELLAIFETGARYQLIHALALLADTDLLWTKPSELVFYAALGLPLVLDDPIGHHEWHNRKWALAAGAALELPDPPHTPSWLSDHLRRGTFCEIAERAYAALPRDGIDRIADALQIEFTGR